MATTIPVKAVIEINGKQVENSFQKISAEARSLERDLKKLVIGSDEYNKKSAELKEVNKHLTEHKAQLNETRRAAQAFNTEINNGSDIISSFKDRFVANLQAVAAGEVTFQSLGAVIKFFAVQSWAALSSIPIVGWVAAVVGAMSLAVREIIQYNTELDEANKLTASITKLQGDALDEITLRSRALEDAFGFDRKDTLEAAKALVNEFKISYTEALDQIEKGAVKGGKANDEYLKSIREYPTFFAKAGFAVQDFIAIVNAGYNLGIYDDKLPDAIKEFTISITEQTKTSRDALVNAFGAPFADELLRKVNTGKITVKDALTEIAAESGKYNLTQKQQAQLTADLFKGAGEDAGGFLAIMQAVTAAAEDLNRPLTETEQILQNQIDKYNELETAKYEAMESDSVIALKREFDMLWKNLQIGYYNFLSWIRQADREFKASGVYMGALFASLPSAAAKSFRGIMDSLSVLVSGFQAGWKAISSFFAGDFDQAEQEFERFKNKYKQFETDINKSVNNFGRDVGKAASDAANKFRSGFDADTKAKGEAERKRLAAEAAKNANNFDGSEAKNAAAKKAADKAAKEAEAARKKEEAERKKHLEQIRRDEEDASKSLLSAKDEYLKNKADLIQNEFERETAKEKARRDIESRKLLTEIAELELKKLETKSAVAKANYQKTIDTLHQIEIQNEEAHQLKLKTIQEKKAAEDFEDFVKAEQRKIEESRRLDEEAINEIATMDEARLALSQMQHLKLTDQELRGIRTLEDAKRALREDADRKMLAASLVSLEKQKAQLEEALKGMTGEAAEKLKADLDILNAKITGIKGAISGGSEADAKKVQEEGDAAKGAVDVLGFSVLQWEECFKNLDTTEGKLRAVGMAFQALSNAGQMFSDLTRSLAERDMRKFEQVQNRKKESLLNQLNTGYITNEQYNKEIQKMEAETANKKAEMEYKQAKADKIARMFAVIGNTAVGVASALQAPPPLNLTLPWIVGAMGAVQLGIVAAQPLPERPSFAGGGFTGSGFGLPDDSGFRPAGIVHENEWVAPEWMTQNPRIANIIGYLESVRLGKTAPMAEGGFAESSSKTAATGEMAAIIPTGADPEMKSFLQRNIAFLEYLIANGVHIEKTAKNGKQIDEMIEEWNSLKNKNKH